MNDELQTESRTLVTGEPTKLPPACQRLLDEDQPLPADVRFFEARLTVGGLTRRVLLGGALLLSGIVLVALGVLLVFLPLLGLVLALVGWILLNGARKRTALVRRQLDGEHLRYGVFLLPEAMLIRTEIDYTLIPRDKLELLRDLTLFYDHLGESKSLMLPGSLVGAEASELTGAIEAWKAR